MRSLLADARAFLEVCKHNAWISLGSLCIVFAMLLDFQMRLRMLSIGDKWIFLKGGLFNYNEYLAAAKKHEWPKWPFYYFWPLFIAGIALLLIGVIRLPR